MFICRIRIVFVCFFFSYLGPSRLSWCSWSPRSQGSQGKRKGFPSDIDDILWHFQNEDFSLCLCRICLHYRRGSCSRITGIWEKEVLVENQCYSPLSWPLYYMLQCFLHSIFKCSGNLEGACMSPAKFQEAQTWQFSHFVGRSCIRVGNLRGICLQHGVITNHQVFWPEFYFREE